MSETMKDTFGSSDVFVSHLQAKMTANNVKSVSAQAISADTSKTPKAVVRHSSPDKGDTPDSDLDKTQSNSMGDYFWVWISVGVVVVYFLRLLHLHIQDARSKSNTEYLAKVEQCLL